MNILRNIAVGGGANQGALILISWSAAILSLSFGLVAHRIKKKSLSVLSALVGATAMLLSSLIAHLFGWWPGPIISAAIILLPIALEVYGILLSFPRTNA